MAGVDADRPERHVRADVRTPAAPERAGGPGEAGRAGWTTAGRAGRWLVPLVPGVVGLVTGGYHLGVPPLWRDEAATKVIASRPAGRILATLPHDDVVHGAYYLVVHLFIGLFGSSNAALRLPSVLAMAVACAFTALIAQRLAAAAGRWQAAGAGITAGAIFAVLPAMIRYAQEARSYAIVTMLATIATHLLLRAMDDGRPRRWAWYGGVVFLTGLCNIFGLLIVVAHGLTLLAARRPERVAGQHTPAALGGRRITGLPANWLVVTAAGSVPLLPVVIMAYRQRNALSWMSSSVPVRRDLVALTHLWAGSPSLAWPVFGLAAFGVAASVIAGRRAVSPATVAVPWLVVPPAVLLAVSEAHPVYDQRYVEFCLPALAICTASGITWLWRGAASAAVGRQPAWLGLLGLAPAVAAAVALVIALQPADAIVRKPSYRPDSLEREARIVADNYRPGDIVFFIPVNDRIVSMPFPGPWRKLRDIALAVPPTASDTLYGIDVSPATLLRRFTHVTRVWVVSSSEVDYMDSARATPLDKEEARLIHAMREIRRWRDNDTELTLYGHRSSHRRK